MSFAKILCVSMKFLELINFEISPFEITPYRLSSSLITINGYPFVIFNNVSTFDNDSFLLHIKLLFKL